jgi:hypothetical protein
MNYLQMDTLLTESKVPGSISSGTIDTTLTPLSFHRLEQHLHLLCCQRSYLLLPDLWRLNRFGDVAWNEAVGDGLLERLVQGGVERNIRELRKDDLSVPDLVS